jgi:hypothetical protein
VLHLAFAFNRINLEALRRIGPLEARRTGAAILFYERKRFLPDARAEAGWAACLPVHPISMAFAALLASMGLVDSVSLPHLKGAGRALKLVVGRARRLRLLDDGLDQYRSTPRTVDPAKFASGTTYALFSDFLELRAPWCARFTPLNLGPLYRPSTDPGPDDHPCPFRTLILDAPGVERLQSRSADLPRPWLVVPHPVSAKRSWSLPPAAGDAVARESPEALLAHWRGTVVVGESMTLLAALRMRSPGCPLLIALPEPCDANLVRLVRHAAAADPRVEVC